MAEINEKTKVPLFVAIATATIAIPAIVGYAIFIYGVSVNAKKGARAADKVTAMYYDIKAIKKELRIKDEPLPMEEAE